MWTRFMDMHSGGGQKLDWAYIYIEENEETAKKVFYNKFGRNPECVTCTCCGEDYSISSNESLHQLTAYDRNCQYIERKEPRDWRYIEDGEEIPEGYKLGDNRYRPYENLDDYMKREEIKFISKDDINSNERYGEVPEQGYVWKDYSHYYIRKKCVWTLV